MHARALKFHIGIHHGKIADPFYLPFLELCPFEKIRMKYCQQDISTVSIRLHFKVTLQVSIGGTAKHRGFFAMCVGYDGKVLIPLWFVHEDSHLVDETT